MEMDIYVNGKCLGRVGGCEAVGAAWVKAQKLAETLNTDCALVNGYTGEVLAWWEP